MTKPKHTPGKWKWNLNKTALLAFDEKNEFRYVFSVDPYNHFDPTNADAALIAAAPEMLEALDLALAYIHDCFDQNIPSDDEADLIKQCENALAKAKGGS